MQTTTKNINLTFIWFAVGILISHNIIPHHHHYGYEDQHQVCEITDEEHGHCDFETEGLLTFCHQTEKNEHCEECHFKTEIPDLKIKTSLILVFSSQIETSPKVFLKNTGFCKPFYPNNYSLERIKRKSDRGPPYYS